MYVCLYIYLISIIALLISKHIHIDTVILYNLIVPPKLYNTDGDIATGEKTIVFYVDFKLKMMIPVTNR